MRQTYALMIETFNKAVGHKLQLVGHFMIQRDNLGPMAHFLRSVRTVDWWDLKLRNIEIAYSSR